MGRALVLGGGGLTGIAWEVGVLVGLRDAGVDLGAADLVVGTSAGSLVGAVLAAGADLDPVVAAQRESAMELGAELDPDQMMAAVAAAMAGARDLQEVRARIGAMALAAVPHGDEERTALIAARLPVHDWPSRRLVVTAVDTGDGAFVTWDRASGVPFLPAVAASCAVPGVWPPVAIGGRRYMDGGVRSVTNADLAAGFDPVVVLAPYTIGLNGTTQDEIASLGDAQVALVSPDDAALTAIGPNPLDPARRGAALDAGARQAGTVGDEVARVWTDGATSATGLA
jgi:NTE family protein